MSLTHKELAEAGGIIKCSNKKGGKNEGSPYINNHCVNANKPRALCSGGKEGSGRA